MTGFLSGFTACYRVSRRSAGLDGVLLWVYVPGFTGFSELKGRVAVLALDEATYFQISLPLFRLVVDLLPCTHTHTHTQTQTRTHK